MYGRSPNAENLAVWSLIGAAVCPGGVRAADGSSGRPGEAGPCQAGQRADIVHSADSAPGYLSYLSSQELMDGATRHAGRDHAVPKQRLLPFPQLSLLTIPAAVTLPAMTGFGDLRFLDIAIFQAGNSFIWGVDRPSYFRRRANARPVRANGRSGRPQWWPSHLRSGWWACSYKIRSPLPATVTEKIRTP